MTHMSKRIVLQTTQGEHAGLWTIIGHCADKAVTKLAQFTPVSFPDGHQGEASLIAVRRRYVLYREFKPELLGVKGHHEGDTPRFSPSQR